MNADNRGRFEAAQVVLPCAELDPILDFFTELGFRIEAIYPADDPAVAVISGHGARIQLQRGDGGDPGTVRLLCRDPEDARSLTAPNGTRVEIVPADPPLVVPPVEPSFVLSKNGDDAAWGTGRAGMRYRDLIPDRQGGAFIASHIRIPEGGPVPDYVHFHKIRFQMIYCYKGWVRLVYEDQGPPFLMEAGDAVLQPPKIRHRVLESAPGLEVIEMGCPAEHETFADHTMTLPTPDVRPERDFGGQRFVRHEAKKAAWERWRLPGFECRDLGIAEATGGLAGARVARVSERRRRAEPSRHDAEFLFWFVLEGRCALASDVHGDHRLEAGDSVVLPPKIPYALSECTEDLELLEVSLPAELETTFDRRGRRG